MHNGNMYQMSAWHLSIIQSQMDIDISVDAYPIPLVNTC